MTISVKNISHWSSNPATTLLMKPQYQIPTFIPILSVAYMYFKVKTEAKEVKRRGKYNKDKAGNLGKLGRKAMKEVKVEQVKVGILRM